MLNRIAFLFYFFYFSGGSWGNQRVSHSIAVRLVLPLVSIFFFFLSYVFDHFTHKDYYQASSASCASWEGLLFSSHAFFSALCVHPLKHAPLIFGEENQAWWFLFIQRGPLQPSPPPGGLLHFCTLHHRLGDQPWGSSERKWWVNMPPVWVALVKDALALVPVNSFAADFSMPDISTQMVSSFVFYWVRFFFESANNTLVVCKSKWHVLCSQLIFLHQHPI